MTDDMQTAAPIGTPLESAGTPDAPIDTKPPAKAEPAPAPKAAPTAREAVADALEKVTAPKPAEAKAGEPAAAAEKPAALRAPDGKFQPKTPAPAAPPAEPGDDDGAIEAEAPKPGEKRHEPPAKFMPRAKELWSNVPHPVKAEITRLAAEHETEVKQYRESHENWQRLGEFDRMARERGTTVHDALKNYTAVDGLLRSNPVEGIRQVLQIAGVTPLQYAQHVMKNPQMHQGQPGAMQPQAQQRGPDPVMQQVTALQQQITQMQQEQVAQQVMEPFRAEHPRFDELATDIAFFLNSDKIPKNLSPRDRLEAAYDFAVRINPTSEASPPASGAPGARLAKPAGNKSITGAPPRAGSVPSSVSKRPPASRGDAVTEALNKVLGR